MNYGALIATMIVAVFGAFGARRVARHLSSALSLPPFSPGTLTAAFFVGMVLPSLAVFGRLTQRFDGGLWGAAIVCVICAVLSRKLTCEPLPRASRRMELGFAVACLMVLALFVYTALMYQMHDEQAIFGRKSVPEQLRRGVFPPYYPAWPGLGSSYHYGFDMMVGVLLRSLNISADAAIDTVCCLMVLFMSWAAAAVVTDQDEKARAPLAAVAIHLSAGLGFLLLAGVPGRHPRCLAQYHHPSCEVELFPTPFLNVFQHPVSIGVPLFLALVLLLPRVAILGAKRDATWRLLAGGSVLVLGALSLGQFVYFALGSLAALSSCVIWLKEQSKETRKKAVLGLVLVLGASLVLAKLCGGMLASHPYAGKGLVGIRMRPGFPKGEGPLGIFWHHTVNLGLGFLLFPFFARAALRKRRPGVVMLVSFAFGGMLVPHLFFYARSWDIVKFPSAAAFAMAMLYVVVIDRALLRPGVAVAWARRFGIVLLLGGGVVSAAFVARPLPKETRMYSIDRFDVDPVVKKAIDWWLQRGYSSEEVIYAQSNIAQQLSIFAGLSVIGIDADLYTMTISMKKINEQRTLAARVNRSMDRAALKALGVKWLMFSDEELRNLGPAAVRALDGFELMHTILPGDKDPPHRRRRIWRVEN